MKLWQYVIWRFVKGVFIILTCPVWFPVALMVLAVGYGVVRPMHEWFVSVRHDYINEHKPSHSIEDAQETAGWDIWKGLTMFGDPSRNDY